MKVVIVEDEKFAAINLESMLKEVDENIEIMAQIGAVADAVEWLRGNKPDLIFMDINLSDGLCFTIFDQIAINIPVIFTTAYDQYAIRAFEVNSIDYLLKPIKIKDLSDSLSKYNSLKSNLDIDFKNLIESLRQPAREFHKRFSVQAGSKIKTVEADDVALFYVLEGNSFLCTLTNENYGIEYPLEKLEAMLDPYKFFRVNRQFIVNIKAIRNMYTMSNRSIKVETQPAFESDIIVSLPRLAEFKNWINQ